MSTVPASNRRPWLEGSMLGAGVLLAALLLVAVNYFGWKYHQRFDWTKTRLYSLSEKTHNVVRTLDKDVNVFVFTSPGATLSEEVQEILSRYQAASPRIKVRVLDPVKNLSETQRLLQQYQTRYAQGSIKVVFDDGTERRIFDEANLAELDYSAMQMGGPPQIQAFKGEEVFTGALLELTSGKKPKVLFVTGHGEKRLDDPASGFQGLSQLLSRNNVETGTWASLGQAAVPDGTDLLVVAGPTASFVPPELDAFSAYLALGGRMLWLLDPPLDPEGGIADLGVEDWMLRLGVKVGRDVVIDPDKTVPFFGAETFFLESFGDHPVCKALSEAQLAVIVSLARSVTKASEAPGYTATELMKTSNDGWGETNLAAPAAKDSGEVAGPVSVGVAVEAIGSGAETPGESAKPKARLVVLGDSNFAGDDLIASNGNAVLLDNAFNWLLKRESFLGIPPKKPEQARLNVTGDQLLKVFLSIALLPIAAVAAGVAVYFKRRR